MPKFLDNIKLPKESIPDVIKENMGEKISMFEKKDKNAPSVKKYVITDYSPIKEKLREIVKSKQKIKDKGEISNDKSVDKEEK